MLKAVPVAFLFAIATASGAQSSGVSATCALWAHVNDPDPSGTNVRAAPTSNSAVLARLKAAKRRKNAPLPVVYITGQQGAWFRISKAERAGKLVFSRTGWIHRSLLAVQVRGNTYLYSGTSRKLRRVQSTGDVEAEGRLLACRAGWAQLRHSGTKKRGWLAPGDFCAGWETTCS